MLYNILWNFSHLSNESDQKRLALAQNPWFYIGLSKLAEPLDVLFMSPLDLGTLTQSDRNVEIEIHVLTGRKDSGRVFFGKDFSKTEKPLARVFDKVWTKGTGTNGTLFFKG